MKQKQGAGGAEPLVGLPLQVLAAWPQFLKREQAYCRDTEASCAAGPLDPKEIRPVHPKGGQCWVFIGRTDAKAEVPILWPPDAKH